MKKEKSSNASKVTKRVNSEGQLKIRKKWETKS